MPYTPGEVSVKNLEYRPKGGMRGILTMAHFYEALSREDRYRELPAGRFSCAELSEANRCNVASKVL